MRVLLLHNPSTGGSDDRAGLLALLHAHGHRPIYRSTKNPAWKRALCIDCELIAIAGGDGTVAKVLRRLPVDSAPVAILPTGSANNIAASLGIVDAPACWVAGWHAAARQPFVRPSVRVGSRHRLFIEAVGVGLFSDVIAMPCADATRGETKVALGSELFRRALRGAAPLHWRLEVDGVAAECEALMLEVLNVPLIGPRLNLSPRMAPAAGALHVVSVPPSARDALDTALQQPGCALALPVHPARHVLIHVGRSAVHVDDVLWPARIARRGVVEIDGHESAVTVLRPQ